MATNNMPDTSNPFAAPPRTAAPGAPAHTLPQTNAFSTSSNPGIMGPSSQPSNPFSTTAPSPFSSGSTNPFATDGSNTESGFNTPGSSLINLGNVPSATSTPYSIPPEIQAMLDGKGGFSPETLAGMSASGTESAAATGQQELAQEKRQLAQNGIKGPAAGAYAGTVARQTGQVEEAAQRDVQLQQAQAQLSQQNMAAQIEAQTGQGNMQSANQLALQNAQMLFQALLANQNARLTTQRTVSGI